MNNLFNKNVNNVIIFYLFTNMNFTDDSKYNNFVDYNENCNLLSTISFNLEVIQKILEKTKQKDKTKKSNYFFTFVKKFSEQGVQGIVGIVILKKLLKPEYNDKINNLNNINKCASGNNLVLSQYFNDINKYVDNKFLIYHDYKCFDTNTVSTHQGYPLVFKVSVDVSNMIYHERNIAKEISTLNSYCPHFINFLGEINIPVSTYLYVGSTVSFL